MFKPFAVVTGNIFHHVAVGNETNIYSSIPVHVYHSNVFKMPLSNVKESLSTVRDELVATLQQMLYLFA